MKHREVVGVECPSERAQVPSSQKFSMSCILYWVNVSGKVEDLAVEIENLWPYTLNPKL